jgi:uncharacterized protein (DUF1684 family)
MLWLILALQLVTGGAYKHEIDQWRAAEEADLRSETGWLTLAGLAWLHEGENRIPMPEGAPDFGVFELHAGKVTLHPNGGAPVEMKADTSGEPTVIERDGYSVFVIERGRRIGIRIRNRNSKARQEFQGMKWFPVRESWRITARWEPFDPPRTMPVPNVLGDVNEEKTPGRAVFALGGKEYSLQPVDSGKQLFFIFRDETSGRETYGGGRFLYTDKAAGGKVILDFNRAVNPPCAFTPYATCPRPPRQNRLSIRIEAGELAPAHH